MLRPTRRHRRLSYWLLAGVAATVMLGSAGCVKEVCGEDSAAFELTVTFEGIDWNDTLKLMAISEVRLEDGRFDRRVSVMDLRQPTDGIIQFIVDPGVWSRDADQVPSVDYSLTLRVLNADMVLLAQGVMSGTFRSGGCQAEQMVVSTGAVECVEEGQPCIGAPDGSGGGHRVCRRGSGPLECLESTCGDGVLDRLAGELCDPSIPDQPCNDTGGLCIPPPQVVDLAVSSSLQFRRQLIGTCNKDFSHVDQAFDREYVDPTREPGWESILPASLAVGDFHGSSPAGLQVGLSGQEVALGAPTGWWDPGSADGCSASTSDPGHAGYESNNRRGKVTVVDLPLTGTSQAVTNADMEPVLVGDSESLFGYALVGADLNGDGYDDLAMSAPVGHGTNGYVLVAPGRNVLDESGGVTVEKLDPRLITIANVTSNAQSRFGHSLAAGDLNGDGYAELVIGSPGALRGTATYAGAVDILAGGPDRFAPGTLYEVTSPTTNPVAVRLLGSRANCRLGKSVAVGDVDGDGLGDVVAGATGAATDTDVQLFVGAVHVLFGTPELLGEAPEPTGPRLSFNCDNNCPEATTSGLSIQAPVDASTAEQAIRFGARVAVGDLDGDGRAEVVVSRPVLDGQGRGVVYIYRGATLAALRPTDGSWAEVDVAPDLTIYGPPNTLAMAHDPTLGAQTGFGHRLLIDDLNGDWQPDLVIAAPLTWVGPDGAVPPRPAAGAAYVIMGSRRASWSGALNLADYEDGTVSEDNANAEYGVVVLRGPVFGAQMGIALASGFRVLGSDDEPNAGLLLAVANHDKQPLLSRGGVLGVNFDGVFDRRCGNGVLELGEQCECNAGSCTTDAEAGQLTCESFGYGGKGTLRPDCNNLCQFDFTHCEEDADPVPCGLKNGAVDVAVPVITQCNENGRDPMIEDWGVTCMDLGYAIEGDLACYLSLTTSDGSCMVNLDSCNP